MELIFTVQRFIFSLLSILNVLNLFIRKLGFEPGHNSTNKRQFDKQLSVYKSAIDRTVQILELTTVYRAVDDLNNLKLLQLSFGSREHLKLFNHFLNTIFHRLS